MLTVVLAFAGYLVTFMSTRMMAQRADMLRLVNKRLNEFYGPLYVASQAGNIAYRSLLKKQGKTQSESAVKVEEAAAKYETTSIRLGNKDGKMRIEEIHIGGTKTKLIVM